MKVDYSKCIDCGLCTKNCVFLEKYNINLKDYANLPDLAYNCYLCGECKRVCPVKIDGRQISLDLREEKIKDSYNLYLNGYGPLLLEKRNYIFKNYKDVTSRVAFFPGCNFLAYYPEVTKYIIKELEEGFGISTIFDCCGKPMADLNIEKEENKAMDRLNTRLKDLGIEELILLCPNCYYYLKTRLDIKVTMIYEKVEIMEALIDRKDSKIRDGLLFLPCPDKDNKIILGMLENYIDKEKVEIIKDIQCCGAGGCASVKEKSLTKDLQDRFNIYNKKIYTYCATCSGMITKSNPDVSHILCEIFGINEDISTGFKTVRNRATFSFKK